MRTSRSGFVVFVIGLVGAVAGLVVGERLAPAVDRVGLLAWLRTAGMGGRVAMGAFIASFPVAALVMMTGAVLGREGRRAGLVVVAVAAAVVAAVLGLVPLLFGYRHSPLYFGVGGCLILGLFASVVWQWGERRRGLGPARRRAADVTMAGYLALACAAWQTCGLGGMPSYMLFPERMIEFGSLPIAVIVLKQVMALSVVGWALTALGHWLWRSCPPGGEGP